MNGYRQYKEKSIYTMSNLELLLLLYDEAVKSLKKADNAIQEKRYVSFEQHLDKTVRIVRYLIEILDMRQPVSRNLRQIYHYLIYDLGRIKAGRERRADEIGRVGNILTELRDGFDQAGRKVQDTHMVMRPEVRG